MPYILRRFSQLPVASLAMLVFIFFAIRLAPGDPATTMLSPVATPAEIEQMRTRIGLNRPIYVQFVYFVGNVLKGDLGKSLVQHRPVLELIGEPLWQTSLLVTTTMIWVLMVSIPIGILSALNRRAAWNHLMTGLTYFGQAAPNFWLGIMLILLLAVQMRLFPSFGGGSVRHIFLPTLALGIPQMARVVRFVRSEMIEVMLQDYIRTANGKGLPPQRVIMGHAFRNMLIPLVTDTGLQYGWLFANAVVIESVFAWPGLGAVTVTAILARDYPLVQASVLTLTFIFILLTFFVDVAYRYIDPRVRYN